MGCRCSGRLSGPSLLGKVLSKGRFYLFSWFLFKLATVFSLLLNCFVCVNGKKIACHRYLQNQHPQRGRIVDMEAGNRENSVTRRSIPLRGELITKAGFISPLPRQCIATSFIATTRKMEESFFGRAKFIFSGNMVLRTSSMCFRRHGSKRITSPGVVGGVTRVYRQVDAREQFIDAQHVFDLIHGIVGTDMVVPTGGRLYQYVMHARTRLHRRNLEEVLRFLMEISPGRRDIVFKILHEHPRILRRNVNSQLRPTEEFLRGLYDNAFLEAISRNPSLLLVSGIGFNARNKGATENFLRKELGMSNASISKIKRTAPLLFQIPVEETIRPTILFLASLLRESDASRSSYDTNPIVEPIEILEEKTRKKIKRVVSNNPSILSLSVEGNLRPTVEFLLDVCRMDKHGVANLVRSCPGVLGLSVEDNLRLTVEFLVNTVGLLDKNDLRRCLCRHPQILGLSLENLQSKVNYFNVLDGMSENENGGAPQSQVSLACRIAVSAPSTYSLSLTDNIMPKVSALGKIWGVSLPDMEYFGQNQRHGDKESKSQIAEGCHTLSRRLSEFPPILTLSLEGNILPTINFYNRTGYMLLDGEACAQKSNFTEDNTSTVSPRYLAASLYNRLLPRWHYLQSKSLTSLEGALPPLHILAGANDLQFCKYFRIDLLDYFNFKQEAVPRLKFSAQFETWIKTGRPIDNT